MSQKCQCHSKDEDKIEDDEDDKIKEELSLFYNEYCLDEFSENLIIQSQDYPTKINSLLQELIIKSTKQLTNDVYINAFLMLFLKTEIQPFYELCSSNFNVNDIPIDNYTRIFY